MKKAISRPPAAGRHPLASRTPVSSIMTRDDFLVVRGTLRLEPLAKLLLDAALTGAAVSDAHGTLIGYVSMGDLVREHFLNGDTEATDQEVQTRMRRGFDGALSSGFHLERAPASTARDIMMPFVFKVEETASIEEAAAMMAFEGVHRLIVISADGKVVGQVLAMDVMRWLGDRDGYVTDQSAKAVWRNSCEYVT